jgi:hypothetical protein
LTYIGQKNYQAISVHFVNLSNFGIKKLGIEYCVVAHGEVVRSGATQKRETGISMIIVKAMGD